MQADEKVGVCTRLVVERSCAQRRTAREGAMVDDVVAGEWFC